MSIYQEAFDNAKRFIADQEGLSMDNEYEAGLITEMCQTGFKQQFARLLAVGMRTVEAMRKDAEMEFRWQIREGALVYVAGE